MTAVRADTADLVERSDYWRGPSGEFERAHKEWQHFVVFGAGWTLALNFNVDHVDDVASSRVISILMFDRWQGHVAQCRAPRVRRNRLDADFDFAGMRWGDGRYKIWQRGDGVRLEIDLVPASAPSLSHNIRLGEETCLSWCLVPRLLASGWFERDGQRVRFDGCLAYHDHNWGHFGWEGDFSWEWACAVSDPPDSGWTVVLSRMNDRARHRTTATTLFLLRNGAHFRYFRNAEVSFSTIAAHDTPPAGRVPAAAALVLPDRDRDVPRSLRVEVRRGDDHLDCEMDTGVRGQILVPVDDDPRRIVRLNEAHARVRVTGQCAGIPVKLEGPGLLEVLRG